MAAEEATDEAAEVAAEKAANEAAQVAAEEAADEVAKQPDRLLKTFQDVSRQDNSRKVKDFSRIS